MATTLNIQTVASLLLLGIYGYWHQNSFLKIKEWKYPDMEQIRKSIVVLLKTQEKHSFLFTCHPPVELGDGVLSIHILFPVNSHNLAISAPENHCCTTSWPTFNTLAIIISDIPSRFIFSAASIVTLLMSFSVTSVSSGWTA